MCSLLCSPFAYSNRPSPWIYSININFGICECPYIINGIISLTQRGRNIILNFSAFSEKCTNHMKGPGCWTQSKDLIGKIAFKSTISTIIVKIKCSSFRKSACLVRILRFIRTLQRFLKKFICTEFITWSDQHLSRKLPKDARAKHYHV